MSRRSDSKVLHVFDLKGDHLLSGLIVKGYCPNSILHQEKSGTLCVFISTRTPCRSTAPDTFWGNSRAFDVLLNDQILQLIIRIRLNDQGDLISTIHA